jgi:hypothetical protein
MSQVYNIYCDESCHLENDHLPVMALGAVWCPLEKSKEVARRIREIKQKHGLAKSFEIKWSKVSPAKVAFYSDVLDYFFDNEDLHFRALIVPDKSQLKHDKFGQDHDTFYYKMYFDMLKVILDPQAEYRIYLDIKDTRSASKVKKLHEVLCNAHYDFNRRIIDRVQVVASREVEQIQLVDVLIGVVQYVARREDQRAKANPGKLALVERMRKRSGYTLTNTTLLREDKVNLFFWKPKVKGI